MPLWFGCTCHPEARVATNQYKVGLSDHSRPMAKHPDVGGLFQDDSAPIHLAQGVTKWFDENDVDHVL